MKARPKLNPGMPGNSGLTAEKLNKVFAMLNRNDIPKPSVEELNRAFISATNKRPPAEIR